MNLTRNRKRFAFVTTLALGASAVVLGRGGEAKAQQVAPPPTPEQALLDKLGKGRRLLVGLGNDAAADPNAEPAYNLGTSLDIHYLYLNDLPGENGWADWNNGQYMKIQAEAMKAKGVIPMFTLYQAAARGDGNVAAFGTDADFMTKYWRGVRLMYTEVAALDVPTIVHLEPDFWGYAQQKGDDPAAVPVQVTAHVPECADLPNDVSGFGKCMVRLARLMAPKALVALQASKFGAYDAAGKPDPARVGAYLAKVGGADADLVVVETLDRDAGCYEVGTDVACHRSGPSPYWNDASFQEHLAWAKAVHDAAGKPLLWWQMPLGVPSETPGSAGHYRDNRVQYFFSHPQQFADVGGIGAAFGTGAPNQTDATSDGGQFRTALTRYNAAPTLK